MDYEKMIDGYNELRERCLELAKKNNGKLMGSDAWLCFAIMDTDITLYFYEDGIECSGMAYTSQTMCSEPFNFRIPMDLIKESYVGAGD
ncbi:hypothetical protein SEA_FAUST_141 [Streptomyces phage Faust]|uniref:Uncharacterized protein n=1 Tax=Streptomyces phage Faust TaxID=2767565 RepID=A0A7G9UYW8_9CAUD|nr:hypothetical protein PP456_gp136 [Streptomyces phage Faust]QNN99223.1 hypothetical protein SEA_FAUST_141 [Streptomyces phage Faust]